MEDVRLLYQAWKTTLQMIDDRGFISETPYSEIGYEEFKVLYSERNCDIYATNNRFDEGKKIYVKFVLNPKVKVGPIKEILEEITEKYIDPEKDDVVLVLRGSYNSNIIKLSKDRAYKYIQVFWMSSLLFNPTYHVFVPKHEKMSKDEVDELMEKYSLKTKTQLPLISKDDAIVRYYNFKTGDVLRITRKSSAIMETVFYRYVR